MAKVGELLVDVLARTSGLSRGLKKGESALQRFKGVAANIATGIAAAFSINALRNMINDFTEFGDSMNKMSIRTGVSVESLSALKFAAEQSGTNINSLGAALFRMNRRIGNFSTAAGPAKRALEMLGFNAKEFIGLPTEEKFMKIVEALQGIDDKALRDQLGFEILGDNFRDLQPLIASGKEGIQALMEEAQRLGIVMSEEDAQAAADFGDAMNRLQKALQAIGTQIASVIVPILTSLSNMFTGLDTQTRNMVVKIGAFGAAFAAVMLIIPRVISIFKMLVGAYQALTSAQVIQQAFTGPKGWATLAASAAVAGVAVAGVAFAMQGMNAELENTAGEAQNVATGAFPQMGNAAKKGADKAKQRLAEVKSEIKSIRDNLKKMQTGFDDISGRGSQSAFKSIVKFQRDPETTNFHKTSLRALEKHEMLLERIAASNDEIADQEPITVTQMGAF